MDEKCCWWCILFGCFSCVDDNSLGGVEGEYCKCVGEDIWREGVPLDGSAHLDGKLPLDVEGLGDVFFLCFSWMDADIRDGSGEGSKWVCCGRVRTFW